MNQTPGLVNQTPGLMNQTPGLMNQTPGLVNIAVIQLWTNRRMWLDKPDTPVAFLHPQWVIFDRDLCIYIMFVKGISPHSLWQYNREIDFIYPLRLLTTRYLLYHIWWSSEITISRPAVVYYYPHLIEHCNNLWLLESLGKANQS